MKKLPVYVALDLDTEEQALLIAKEIAPYVEGFKVGPRLCLRNGASFLSKLKSYGKVFLDCKFFDIPSTMLSSVQTAFDLGVDMLTVHALAGEESLKKLAKLENDLRIERDFRILAVTVLTSFAQRSLPPMMQPQSLYSHVESLSNIVMKSGLTGLVCSGGELISLRKRYSKAYLLTPGIRFASSPTQDQKRVFTPQKAIQDGASALVIGRPIYQSKDPVGVCARLQKELAAFL